MGNWFDTDFKKGKVTLDQQMQGLDFLFPIVSRKTIFDLGCAEGHIGELMLDVGASLVEGIDNRADATDHARKLGIVATCGDVENWKPSRDYDVFLMLGILHKLKDPAATLRRALNACLEFAVIRLPYEQWPVLVDSRSGSKEIDLGAVARESGFNLIRDSEGPHGQWIGYLARVA